MRHKVAGRKLSRATGHRMALYRNLVTDLLRYEKIVTTEAKAKEARSLAEKVITLGKQKDLHARRQALSFVYDKDVVDKLFTELAPRYAERPGGYTRVVKLGPRLGDGAQMAQLELV
jgi:large subunit ribosomal protein L17